MVKFTLIAAFAALASAKITPSVHRHLQDNKLADVVLEFNSIASVLEGDDMELESFSERAPRIAHVRSRLIDNMQASQEQVVQFLSSRQEALTVRTERFHIDNTMHISGADLGMLEKLAKFDSVTRIRSPIVAHLPVLKFDKSEILAENSTEAANEWGIDLIGANNVWANGNRGEGVVVGGIDSGVLYTHEALKANWRSNYGWFDPTDKSATPIDTNGHGTHTMGSSVGSGGIGVAPRATWIACRGCIDQGCPEAALTGCAQWMLCPTDAAGDNPKCELAPHVINNSWGGSNAGNNWYQAHVDAWQKAGIIPVFANGNSGPSCATVGSPGGYKNVIGVGAVGADDKLWTASSRGPTPDKRIKPDVTAPGHKVRSSWHTGNSTYNTISGTSMATPHVTGAVALYLSANNGAKYDDVYKAFTTTVDTKTLTPDNKNCGGVKDATYPNNNYGFGRINVARALGSPTNTPVTTATPKPSKTSVPAPATTPRNCKGCNACYSTEYFFCFLPSTYTEEQCAKLSFKTIWCARFVERFYINGNMHVYGANRMVLDELTKLKDVARIRLPVVVPLPVISHHDNVVDVLSAGNATTSTRAGNEWGVNLINAPAVWATGNRGSGVVVGILDSGVIHTHVDLRSNYRASYGWFDPTDRNPSPIDSVGHGTHVAGTAVGQNGIGVAPGATWIACRGCTTDSCPEAALSGCAQFMLCPTDVNGQNPKCELAPHVINNSWGGGRGSTWYQSSVDAWRAAGIIPVFANGNAGSNCNTANSPGDYRNVIGVGAVSSDDTLASFSSRGPTVDGRIKPDVSAPGNRVRSAWNTGNTAYNTISGTSMASPHVTGAIALYLSANKGATYDAIYRAFTTTVDTATLTPDNRNCGGVRDSSYPNNNYGFGRINAARRGVQRLAEYGPGGDDPSPCHDSSSRHDSPPCDDAGGPCSDRPPRMPLVPRVLLPRRRLLLDGVDQGRVRQSQARLRSHVVRQLGVFIVGAAWSSFVYCVVMMKRSLVLGGL